MKQQPRYIMPDVRIRNHAATDQVKVINRDRAEGRAGKSSQLRRLPTARDQQLLLTSHGHRGQSIFLRLPSHAPRRIALRQHLTGRHVHTAIKPQALSAISII